MANPLVTDKPGIDLSPDPNEQVFLIFTNHVHSVEP